MLASTLRIATTAARSAPVAPAPAAATAVAVASRAASSAAAPLPATAAATAPAALVARGRVAVSPEMRPATSTTALAGAATVPMLARGDRAYAARAATSTDSWATAEKREQGALVGKLLQASFSNDVAEVKRLIKDAGVPVNSVDYDRRSALHIAASEGHLDVVKLLVDEFQADVNLLDRWEHTPLTDAMQNNHTKVLELLNERGAAKGIGSGGTGRQELLRAAGAGDIETVRRLLDMGGVSVDAAGFDGRTALQLAARLGHVEVVRMLIERGAAVNHVDVSGSTPLSEASKRRTTRHRQILSLLAEAGAVQRKDVHAMKWTSEFSAAVNASLSLLCQRSHWDYVEVWVPSDDGAKLVSLDMWYAATDASAAFANFRNHVEHESFSQGEQLVGRVWATKKPQLVQSISQAPDLFNRQQLAQCQEHGVTSAMALPILVDGHVLVVLQLYAKEPSKLTDNQFLELNSFANNLILAGSGGSSSADIDPKQVRVQTVYDVMNKEGKYNPQFLYQEVDWWFNDLGLQEYYTFFTDPTTVSQHIHAYIAAKKVAEVTGDPEDVHFDVEKPASAFYLCADTKDSIAATEARVEKYLNKMLTSKPADTLLPFSLAAFRSTGPLFAGSKDHLGLYIISTTEFTTPPAECIGETNITKIATGVFLRDKTSAAVERYQQVIREVQGAMHPIVKLSPPLSDGCVPVMIAFPRFSSRYNKMLTMLCSANGLVVQRKFIESFSNGMVVFSYYFQPPQDLSTFHRLISQIDLVYHIPQTSISPLFYETGQLTAQEYAYAHCVNRFVYYFVSQRSEDLLLLQQALANDPVNSTRLADVQQKLRKEAVTQARLESCLISYPELVADLYKQFERRFAPALVNAANKHGQKGLLGSNFDEVEKKITQVVDNELDATILKAFVMFNKFCLKTNFFVDNKAAISFRLDTAFLAGAALPEVPFGFFYICGAYFRGFHIRFRDIARGGIRLIKSNNRQAYSRNLETLFAENYNLAYTQQKKNKDIPEGGSKGTILARRNISDPDFLFHQYVDSMLDLLLKSPDVVDYYGKEEVLFFGPDENTAHVMDWAALHSRKRGYKFWKAFTTGKSPTIGGIPHDEYGMTTNSVHTFVVEALKAAGLIESTVTKLQTGGPDGDLGSNEITISSDRTTSIVDGSGVIHDPNGLDRVEMTRLAHERKMIDHFDLTKLGPKGFRVLVGDRSITLPSGERVESGLTFRNEFHLNPLSSADLFVPCGGRPESVNHSNVQRLFNPDGTPRFKIIVEGANLFFTQQSRLILEAAGVVLFKDASANKGGVTSSSCEVLAALAFTDDDFQTHMCVRADGTKPAFYQSYVAEVVEIVRRNALMECRRLMIEYERTKTPRCVLTDSLSAKVNELNDRIQADEEMWKNLPLRNAVLSRAIPKSLLDKLGLEAIVQRVPDTYLRAIFGAHLAAYYVYEQGPAPSELAFYRFMSSYTPK